MKYRFVKEITPNGEAQYYTERLDGETWGYVMESLSYDRYKAERMFDIIVARKGEKQLEVLKEI